MTFTEFSKVTEPFKGQLVLLTQQAKVAVLLDYKDARSEDGDFTYVFAIDDVIQHHSDSTNVFGLSNVMDDFTYKNMVNIYNLNHYIKAI